MFEKVAIIGIGLLGGSLARDLKIKRLANTVVGVCRSDLTKEFALQNKVVDKVQLPVEAVQGADLIVFATPMQTMLPILDEVSEYIPSGAVMTDVGSVKGQLYDELKSKHSNLLNRFVLAHPIAGGQHSGVQASKTGLFENKHLIIADTEEVSKQAHQKVMALWRELGSNVVAMSLQQHDAVFAKTSHLPHVIAFSLVNFLSQQGDREQLFEMAAAGFYDFTRIASSNAQMWRDICMTNREQVLTALDGFREQLEDVRDQIEQSDQSQLLDYFNAAKQARDTGLLKKNR